MNTKANYYYIEYTWKKYSYDDGDKPSYNSIVPSLKYNENYKPIITKFIKFIFAKINTTNKNTCTTHETIISKIFYKQLYKMINGNFRVTDTFVIREHYYNYISEGNFEFISDITESEDITSISYLYKKLNKYKTRNPFLYKAFITSGDYQKYPFSTKIYQTFLASIDYGVTLFLFVSMHIVTWLCDDKLIEGESMLCYKDIFNSPQDFELIEYKEGIVNYKYKNFIDAIYTNITESSKQTKLLGSSPFDSLPVNFESLKEVFITLIQKLSVNIEVNNLPTNIKNLINLNLANLLHLKCTDIQNILSFDKKSIQLDYF